MAGGPVGVGLIADDHLQRIDGFSVARAEHSGRNRPSYRRNEERAGPNGQHSGSCIQPAPSASFGLGQHFRGRGQRVQRHAQFGHELARGLIPLLRPGSIP